MIDGDIVPYLRVLERIALTLSSQWFNLNGCNHGLLSCLEQVPTGIGKKSISVRVKVEVKDYCIQILFYINLFNRVEKML